MFHLLLLLSLLNINILSNNGIFYSIIGVCHNASISYPNLREKSIYIGSDPSGSSKIILNNKAIETIFRSEYLRSMWDFHHIRAEKPDSAASFFQDSSPTPAPSEIVQTPMPTKKIPKGQTRTPRPTATPPDIPPPADPNRAKLMIFLSIIAVSIILVGVWLNRRTFE